MSQSTLDSIGRVTIFGAKALRDAWFPPFEVEYLGTQLYEIGVGSLLLVVASGFALGVVLTLHTRSMLVQFGATADIPVFQSLAFFNEIGPLVTGLLMAGRVGAGWTTLTITPGAPPAACVVVGPGVSGARV